MYILWWETQGEGLQVVTHELIIELSIERL